MKPIMTRELALAIARDTANRQMRAERRIRWNQDDYNLAARTFNRLYAEARITRAPGAPVDRRE